MADYGITTTGFNRKTYNDLLEQFEADLKSQDAFGENIDFSQQDPLYQFSVPYIYMLSELWELAENVFYSTSPKFAEGVPLSNTGKFIGIARKQATKAEGIATFVGAAGTTIETGFLVGADSGVTFETKEKKVIPTSGSVDIPIIAQVAGSSGNTPANTITTIINPMIGLSSVTNNQETTKGQDQESDPQFRTRYDETTQGGDGSTAIAIRNNLLQVTGVSSATVKENDTNDTVDNIPAHSIFSLVKGGADTDVANSIFEKKPGGIGTYGSVSINVTDTQGIVHTINFSRPTNKNIWINVTITKGSDYPVDGDTLIQNAVVSYINALDIGEDIIVYKLINTIASLGISGIEDIAIQTSTDGTTFTSNNITVSAEENAITDIDKVVVQ